MKRVNITLEDNVIERIDNFAKSRGLSRSALISLSCMTYIDAQEQLPKLQAQLDELKSAVSDLEIKSVK